MSLHVANQRITNFALYKGPTIDPARKCVIIITCENNLQRKVRRLLIDSHITVAVGDTFSLVDPQGQIRDYMFSAWSAILVENHVVH